LRTPHETQSCYVGTFKIMYPPSSAKIKSGAHAARNGGNWLIFPIASNNPDTVQYITAIHTAVATPVTVPRRPAAREKGIASTAITRVIMGKANFFSNCTRSRTTSKPLCCRSRM